MKNSSKSESKKHNHAVVVNYLFSKKGELAKIDSPFQFYNINALVQIDHILDKSKGKLKFKKLIQNFMSTTPYEESKERKMKYEEISENEYNEMKRELDMASNGEWNDPWRKQDNIVSNSCDTRYYREYPLLGEYDKENKRIILYVNNIVEYCCYKDGGEKKICKDNYMRITTIHELFHAYFHFVTEQSLHRLYKNNYIFEIEEAMIEFCMLVFIKNQEDDKWNNDVFTFAEENVKSYQKHVGNLAAYGFGYYLYDNLNEEDKRFELINNYIKNLGNIDENDEKVINYKKEVRLSQWGDRQKCLNLLQEILKP